MGSAGVRAATARRGSEEEETAIFFSLNRNGGKTSVRHRVATLKRPGAHDPRGASRRGWPPRVSIGRADRLEDSTYLGVE